MPKYYTEHYVLEQNLSVAMKSGHIVAQTPLQKANFGDGSSDWIDNGYFLAIDIADAEFKTGIDSVWYIHWTEEIFEDRNLLKDWTVEFDENGYAYPRMVAVYTGDVWTTNNYTGTLATNSVAYVDVATGQLTIVADKASLPADTGVSGVAYNGPLFHVTESTLPDGSTPAGEFFCIEMVTIPAAA